ncbi:MAG: hypothetical protein NWE92_12485 [Candidatus Bathyarchaeota archaeon]|nr:hypothetical protein [Candidatus Bathyarchaeota archaeon]
MKLKKASMTGIFALAFIGIALSVVTAGVLVSQQISSSGSIISGVSSNPSSNPTDSPSGGGVSSTVDLSLYSDSAATTPCSSIEWGSFNPGASANRTIYVKNTGNVAETLTLTTTDWSPDGAASVVTLTWDKENSTLAAGAVTEAILTLTVANETGSITDFNFNIVISGSA